MPAGFEGLSGHHRCQQCLWAQCGGIGSAVSRSPSATHSVEAFHSSLGVVGHCHVHSSRWWADSPSLETCTRAETLAAHSAQSLATRGVPQVPLTLERSVDLPEANLSLLLDVGLDINASTTVHSSFVMGIRPLAAGLPQSALLLARRNGPPNVNSWTSSTSSVMNP